MRVGNSVTQSSLNDVDEEVAHLSGSRERTGRRKNMTKKMKVRVSALVMCAAMLVSAMVVWAGTVTETVPLDGSVRGVATGYLSRPNLVGYAQTEGVSLYNDILETSIEGFGSEYDYASGWNYAQVDGLFTYASTYHKWTGRTHTMTVYP